MSKQLQAWEGEERKLQSVFDDISSHRLAPAQATLTRYLKKHPKSQPALILRMYILNKTGSSDTEVLKVFREVQALGGAKKEMTGRGVWWCTLTLRNMGRLDLAQKVYEDLYEIHPETLQLLEQVFTHAVAAQDVETAVKSSRKMFNSTRETRWARLAAWAEWVQKAPQPIPSNPWPAAAPAGALKIAQILLSTTGAECETSEIFWLRAQMLLSSGQDSDVLKLAGDQALEGGLARLWWRMEAVKAAMERWGDAGREEWEVEREWVGGLLETDDESRRNYAYYRYLLLTTLHSTDPEALEGTVILLNTLKDEIDNRERAPKLAGLELENLLRKEKLASNVGVAPYLLDDQQWLEILQQYWVQWGAKGPIVTEIEGILEGVSEKRKEMALAFVKEQAARQHTDEQTYREQVNAEIILLRAQPTDWVPTSEDIGQSWKLYTEGLAYGKNLPKTDVQPADQIGLVAVDLLITQWHSSPKDLLPLHRAIVSLERICSSSVYCMHAHFLLIRLYRLIGAPSLIVPHLTRLDVSEIQLDNILHVVLERGGGEAAVGKLSEVWAKHVKKATDMYARSATDLPEYVKECLNNETYSKIPSIQYLDKSLRTSLSHRMLVIEQARYALQTAPSPAALPAALFTSLRKAAASSEVTDLRNWELVQEIGGKRASVREMTEFSENRVGEAWVKVMSKFWLAVGEFLRGGEVKDDVTVDADDTSLLPCERALVKSGLGLLQAASKALTDPQPGAEVRGDEVPGPKTVFDEITKTCLSDHPSRWSLIQSFTSLQQLLKLSDAVLARIAEAAKPVKGKKKPTHLNSFGAELKAAKDFLKEKTKELEERLDAVEKEGAVDWAAVGGAGFEDVDFAQETGKKIDAARREALQSVKDLLMGKK
ncbi:hypothetical protein IAT38_005237 [Cryptococcus sp. DSM 104549]